MLQGLSAAKLEVSKGLFPNLHCSLAPSRACSRPGFCLLRFRFAHDSAKPSRSYHGCVRQQVGILSLPPGRTDDFYGIFRAPPHQQLPETQARRTCTDRGSRHLTPLLGNIWKKRLLQAIVVFLQLTTDNPYRVAADCPAQCERKAQAPPTCASSRLELLRRHFWSC